MVVTDLPDAAGLQQSGRRMITLRFQHLHKPFSLCSDACWGLGQDQGRQQSMQVMPCNLQVVEKLTLPPMMG